MRQLIDSIRHHRLRAVIIVVLLLINVAALRGSLRFFNRISDSAFLRYGDKMPRLSGRSLSGSKTIGVVEGRVNLILYLSASQSRSRTIETAKSAELLWRSNGKDGLGVTAIVRGDIPDLDSLVEHSLVSYDTIVDPTGDLGDKLGVAESGNGVFLFGPDGRCRFSTRNPIKGDDLRQLVAVEFQRTDPLDKLLFKHVSVEKGHRFVDRSLLDVRSLRPTSIDQVRAKTSGLFVFFTADCSICSLPEYLKTFLEYERKRKLHPNNDGDAALVFDFNFSHTDVLEQMTKFAVSSPAYIAGEELTEINDLALTDPSHFGQVVAVELDRVGTVQRILSIGELDGTLPHTGGSDNKAAIANLPSYDAEFGEMFPGATFSIYDVSFYNGHYYVSDIKGNRILVLNEHGDPEREIGGIGSGPGRMLHPGYLGVAGDGSVYVQDGGNERIERFKPDGTFEGEFRTSLFEGFAVAPQNEVYLGQPENGYLVTVYSASGKKLRSFGELKKFSQVYGDKFSYKDDLYNIAINRVRLTVDSEGSLYVSFMLAPILQKYDSRGKLLFERQLEGPEIDNLTRVLLTDTTDKYLSTSMDGFEARIIALNPAVDSTSGKIYVILADGSVYIAGTDGSRVMVLHPRAQHGFTPYMAGVNAKGELLVVSFFYWRCYRLRSPLYMAPGIS